MIHLFLQLTEQKGQIKNNDIIIQFKITKQHQQHDQQTALNIRIDFYANNNILTN